MAMRMAETRPAQNWCRSDCQQTAIETSSGGRAFSFASFSLSFTAPMSSFGSMPGRPAMAHRALRKLTQGTCAQATLKRERAAAVYGDVLA